MNQNESDEDRRSLFCVLFSDFDSMIFRFWTHINSLAFGSFSAQFESVNCQKLMKNPCHFLSCPRC